MDTDKASDANSFKEKSILCTPLLKTLVGAVRGLQQTVFLARIVGTRNARPRSAAVFFWVEDTFQDALVTHGNPGDRNWWECKQETETKVKTFFVNIPRDPQDLHCFVAVPELATLSFCLFAFRFYRFDKSRNVYGWPQLHRM